MKKIRIIFLVISIMSISLIGICQNLEVEGHIKIGALDLDNSQSNFIIRKNDGTLGRRVLSSFQKKKYVIGEFAHGGIVFWLDETGEHGLVCSISNIATDERWYAGDCGHTRAYGDGPGAGRSNTSIIIAAQVAIGDDGSTYAARICNEYFSLDPFNRGVSFNHGDWYLPSLEELKIMYNNKAAIEATAVQLSSFGAEGFNDGIFWSSTETGSCFAAAWQFSIGFGGGGGKAIDRDVRAVRIF